MSSTDSPAWDQFDAKLAAKFGGSWVVVVVGVLRVVHRTAGREYRIVTTLIEWITGLEPARVAGLSTVLCQYPSPFTLPGVFHSVEYLIEPRIFP